MALGSALQIGKSGLIAAQAAIEVTGNNLVNIGTRGYHRRSINLTPIRGENLVADTFIGRGVQVQAILRHVDEALEGRIRDSIADQSASAARRDILAQIEALQNEFTDNDLSSQLADFFNAWSELANNPRDNSLRSLVVQSGDKLASFIKNLKGELVDLRLQVDHAIDGAASAADDLLQRIEVLNEQIVTQEAGGGRTAHSLRDERDLVLGELAEYLDISVNEQPSGVVDVFVGALPMVLNGDSRGIEVRRTTINGNLQIDLVIKDDGSVLIPTSGRIGSLLSARVDDVTGAIDTLDQYANDLIYHVNRVHSQGQGLDLFDSVTGLTRVADTAVVLTDPATAVPFAIGHGSFQIHVTQKSTGQRTTQTINIDLDGIGGNDTTLTDLAAALNAVPTVNASITTDGRLQISAAGADFALGFSDDTSGVLAALGINSYFAGEDASDIQVNDLLTTSVRLLAAARNHDQGDNSNALAMADLRTDPIASLNGLSLAEVWGRHVEDYAIRLGQTRAGLDANTIVRGNLETQQQQTSGVSADEEAINLLTFQRTFQASARFLQVVDELIETMLSLV